MKGKSWVFSRDACVCVYVCVCVCVCGGGGGGGGGSVVNSKFQYTTSYLIQWGIEAPRKIRSCTESTQYHCGKLYDSQWQKF